MAAGRPSVAPQALEPHALYAAIIANLPHTPTEQQLGVAAALARFLTAPAGPDAAFILNGYAGTGKTSLIGAAVKALQQSNVATVLMAPTGRAAKVFGTFAGIPASTIHRRIYRHSFSELWSGPGMPAENNAADTVFIVDEASMIGNDATPQSGGLLDDLLQYVFGGTNCRLILIGDTAQLPPVGTELSPALNAELLRTAYGLKVNRAVMTSTVRQAAASGILYNATRLRQLMKQNPIPEPSIHASGFTDVRSVNGEEMLDALTDAYRRDGYGETLIITRSNRRAVLFNQAVRNTILERTELLVGGERLMVAKNNYLWSKGVKGLDFIANGDMAVVNRIHGTETRYGFKFADVSLTLPDRDIDFDCKILLDCLYSEAPALTAEQQQAMQSAMLSDPDMFTAATPIDVRVRMLRNDPMFNALQVKYAYAVTCHKAQGGQWRNVFVDLSYIGEDSSTPDFYRWLYTAVTRATSRLYFVNPAITVR